ncbi:antibiotic biosynthesis monooxygenase [Cyclobacteriaceae bacterium YHN15]|nr:antibiotic biosynthesis monooxygenase [Cyclobacteriaceae bacterium YHN15]
MIMIANTPKPPYYAVIFTSIRTEIEEDYNLTAIKMVEMAQEQEGYLGHESAREDLGITVSYWQNLDAIKNWKMNLDHLLAQKLGKSKWYAAYKTRICLVERDYGFDRFL